MLSIMEEVVEELHNLQEENNPWHGSRFEKLDQLKLDYSGKAGERYLQKVCEHLGIPVYYDEDKISEEGTWDIGIDDHEIEVKTARQGKQKSFQHENLRSNEECDDYMFVDVTPSHIYLTIIEKSTIDFTAKHPILGRTPHLRRNSDNQYKWDFGMAAIHRGVEHGITFIISEETEAKDLKAFIMKRLGHKRKVLLTSGLLSATL